MGNLCCTEEDEVRYEKVNDVPDWNGLSKKENLEKQREIAKNMKARHVQFQKNMQEKKAVFESRKAAYKAGMKAIPNRRMRLRKTAVKRKSKTTRSEYVKKTEKKGKGVKNYLGNVISNVADSVKNTGKAVLSPVAKKTKKVVKKVVKK
jgi:hypothetical protein